ncbi:hypothetical protein R3I93_012447 [Phoxinus phoxinus]|uniref:Uncharacterized protein n=1 Tax=Phoxinus phoxinus TaxID=58324 RepID=A0AAN9CS66_9TELE
MISSKTQNKLRHEGTAWQKGKSTMLLQLHTHKTGRQGMWSVCTRNLPEEFRRQTVKITHTSEIVGINTINMKLVFAPLQYPLTLMGHSSTMLKHQDSEMWSLTDLNVQHKNKSKVQTAKKTKQNPDFRVES